MLMRVFHNQNHFSHTALISGYDENKRIFILSDFLNGPYRRIEINYENFINAYRYAFEELIANEPLSQYHRSEIILLRPKKAKYKFSMRHMIYALEDYASGCDRTGRFVKESHLFTDVGDYKFSYGVGCTSDIAGKYRQGILYLRELHILYDHKKAMRFRLEYLSNKLNIDLKYYILQYEVLENMALKLRNMALKINISGKGDIDLLVNEYRNMENTEKTILYKLINELQKI